MDDSIQECLIVGFLDEIDLSEFRKTRIADHFFVEILVADYHTFRISSPDLTLMECVRQNFSDSALLTPEWYLKHFNRG